MSIYTLTDVCDVVHYNSCYEMVFSPMTWQEASDGCASGGGRLADISDQEEYEAIFSGNLGENITIVFTNPCIFSHLQIEVLNIKIRLKDSVQVFKFLSSK